MPAIALATLGDAEGLAALRDRLVTDEFLRRLDDVDNPQRRVLNLSRLFSALETHPSAGSLKVCLAVANSPEFTSVPIRLNYALPALLAVRPVGEEAAAIVRRTNDEGFYTVNAPLLVRNASPTALRLFEEMIRDGEVEPSSRINAVHVSVLPYRTEVPVLQMARRLFEGGGLDPAIQRAVIETIFDLQSRRWFGPVRVAPTPRPWDTASDEALALVLELGGVVQARTDLRQELRSAVERTMEEVSEILANRRR